MYCFDCFKKIKKSYFYNFQHPLNEIVIMNNKHIHTQQPVYEKNTFLYNKYNRIEKYENLKEPYNKVQIPKIIIEDTDEDIIFDKFRADLNNILINKIKIIKNNELKHKKDIVEKLLEKNRVFDKNLRNRKNKIDVIENIEWDVIE